MNRIHFFELIELVLLTLEWAYEAASDVRCESRFASRIGRESGPKQRTKALSTRFQDDDSSLIEARIELRNFLR